MEETTISRCLSLMKSKEDTSKFVAISILPSILSKKPSLSYECWKALDFKWIDRLLKSSFEIRTFEEKLIGYILGKSSSEKSEDSSEYKILAVNILISFASFPELSEHPDMINRIPCLMSILCESDISFIDSTLDLLIVLSQSKQGALKILECQQNKNMNSFIETLDEVLFEKMINLMKHACIKSVSDMEEINFKLSLKKCINDLINILENSKGKKRLIMFSFFNDVFSNINTGICNSLIKNMEIKKALYNILHTLIKEDQSDSTRKMTSNLLCLMLRLQNLEFILSCASNEEEARTFCVLFTNLASVDIRSILPTVMKKLISEEINEESHRLSTDYEILESMIIYLSNSETVVFQFSELLLLQRSFKEAFEESIDFLKDRWDNFNKNKNSLKNDPEIFNDLIVISSIRSLCLWLKEDDSLRKYAISIMDMFMYLWNKKNAFDIDYRIWICDGLQGIITTEEGWNSFHSLGFWDAISTNLIKNELEEPDHSCIYTKLSECDLLLQAIERYQNPQKNWINIIKYPKKINKNDPLKAEFFIKIIILSLIIFQKLGKDFSKQNEQLFSEHLEISLTWIHFLDSKRLNCSWTIPIELKDKMLIHLQNLHPFK